MASANEPGELTLAIITPTGQRQVVWRGRSDSAVNAGKSPDGVLANLTADKQVFLQQGGYIGQPGDVVQVFFKPDATDGLDVSDGVYQVPAVIKDRYGNRSTRTLNATDLGITVDLTPIAARETALGAGYTIPDGTMLQLGGGLLVLSVEDDTA